MFTCINGFTKESMIETIKREFKGKAITNAGNCEYKTQDGKKCAVGCFIPEDKYNHIIEGTGMHSLKGYTIESAGTCAGRIYFLQHLNSYMPLSYEALEKFQDIHDNLDVCDLTTEDQLNTLIKWVNTNVE